MGDFLSGFFFGCAATLFVLMMVSSSMLKGMEGHACNAGRACDKPSMVCTHVEPSIGGEPWVCLPDGATIVEVSRPWRAQ